MIRKEYYTVREAAKILGVNPITIYRWIKKGILEAYQPGKGGRYRIPRLEIPTFAR